MKTTKKQIEWAFSCAENAEEQSTVMWAQAERILAEAGWCPYCACDGERIRLGSWESGTHEDYAGRWCPWCQKFAVCGNQPTGFMRPDEPDVDASGACYSDAVPGF